MIGSRDLAPSDLDAVDNEQLAVKLKDAKQELSDPRFTQATGQLRDHGRIKAVRRGVTRTYTIYRRRKLGTRTESSVEKQAMAEDVIEQAEHNHRKMRRGYMVSDRIEKAIIVRLEDREKHPLYGKVMRKTKRIKVHDEHNAAGIGDLVVIMETRPLSTTKHWRLVEIAERAR